MSAISTVRPTVLLPFFTRAVPFYSLRTVPRATWLRREVLDEETSTSSSEPFDMSEGEKIEEAKLEIADKSARLETIENVNKKLVQQKEDQKKLILEMSEEAEFELQTGFSSTRDLLRSFRAMS